MNTAAQSAAGVATATGSTRTGRLSKVQDDGLLPYDLAIHSQQAEQSRNSDLTHSRITSSMHSFSSVFRDREANQSHWLLDHMAFQASCGFLVFANTISMGLEAEVGSDHATWSGLLGLLDIFFTVAFLVEMIVKIICLRRRYVRDAWNGLDAFVTILGVMDVFVLNVFLQDSNIDLRSLSILRVLRLVRLVRVLKLMKSFKKVVIIINGVTDAIRTTLWVALVLFGAIYVCAIFCVDVIGRGDGVHTLYPGYEENEAKFDDFELFSEFNPYLSFGRLSRAMLTLFNIAILAEWTEVVVPISVKQPWMVLFFILFGLFITFGVMNVIIGLIVDNVMANARAMSTEEEGDEQTRKVAVLREMSNCFESLDTNDKGHIDQDDLASPDGDIRFPLAAFLKRSHVHNALSPAEFFTILDENRDGKVSLDEFVLCMSRLIGLDDNKQVSVLLMYVKHLKHSVHVTHADCSTRLGRLEVSLQRMEVSMTSLLDRLEPASADPDSYADKRQVSIAKDVSNTPVAPGDVILDRPDREAKQAKLVAGRGVAGNATRQDILLTPSTELERLTRALEGMRRLESGAPPGMTSDTAAARSMEEVSRILESARREAEDAIQCKLRETVSGCLKVVEHALEASGIELPNADMLRLSRLEKVSACPGASAAGSDAVVNAAPAVGAQSGRAVCPCGRTLEVKAFPTPTGGCGFQTGEELRRSL